MKAVTEALSPTRVKVTVEVPFDELRPSLDVAYRKLAGQVRVQGFRPGKVPPRILDQRLGRGAVLDEALQDAVPRFYSAAITEHEVEVLGRPSVDVTSFGDGEQLVFTAEVDVRPELELPDYEQLAVTVDAAAATDEEIGEQLGSLRDRFAVLEAVQRPVEAGDYVSIDMSARVAGEPVDDARATGLSYEVGEGSMLVGLDEALVGMSEGETAQFASTLVAGDRAGQEAEVSVAVRSVKRKSLPEFDDDFATTASEFDTIDELRADVRARIERIKRLQQGMQARDRTLEVLVEATEVPVPEAAVQAEVEARLHNLGHQLEGAGLTLAGYLETEGKTQEEFDTEVRDGSAAAVKASLLLDAIARKEQLGVDENDITEQIVRRAQRAGIEPQAYADQLVQGGQLQSLVGEIARAKALATVVEGAVITDSNGSPVELAALQAEMSGGPTEPTEPTELPE